jgi:hypothetical protein
VAQWLYSLGDIGIHATNDEAFRCACANGALVMVQWLYSLEGISNEVIEKIFVSSTISNEIKSWLRSFVVEV